MNITYTVRGTGKPLILIPGIACGAWNWFCQIDEFAENFQLITFDPRGIGSSSTKNPDELENLSIKTFAADVLSILDKLNIEKANVLGASFGGFVALVTALEFPERVDKLVLSCTSAGGANHVKPDIEILRGFTPDPSLTLAERIRKIIFPSFTEEFNFQHAEQVAEVCRLREINAVEDPIYFAQLHAAFTFDTENRLGEIKNKTLVITGDRDNIVPAENSINLAKNIPNAELKIIKNGSHLFFIENSKEFNRTVIDFLKS